MSFRSFARPSPKAIAMGIAVCWLASACTQKKTTAAPIGVSPPPIGECIERLNAAGVVSAEPVFSHADRDLNGDGRSEIVVSDRKMCRESNCQWNIFAYDGSCHRFIGSIAGAAIEVGPAGDYGYLELRSWWRFRDGRRALLHVYRFGQEGYQLVETLMCHQRGDDGIQCASEEVL